MEALHAGMEDYATDQRGDVGSWIRVSCCRGLSSLPGATTICSMDTWELVVARMLKLAVEKLEVVRQAALSTLAILVPKLDHRGWTEDLATRL